MTNRIKLFSLLLFLCCAASARNSDTDVDPVKSYTKTYAISPGERVLLENKFGTMTIVTWRRNEVKVDVSLSVKSGSDAQSRRTLEGITIADSKTNGEIAFRTVFRQDNNDDSGEGAHVGTTTMHIDYTVYLPSNIALNAINLFGDISIPDFDGPLTLESRFGSLTAGNIKQAKSVSVQFGKKVSTIASLESGKLSVRFSKAIINRLGGDASVELTQCKGVLLKLDPSLKKLDLKTSFSDVLVDVPRSLPAQVKLSANFGAFHNESVFGIEKDPGPDGRYGFQNDYYTLRNNTGTIPIAIKSDFGDLTIGHDLRFDPDAPPRKPGTRGH